MSSSIIKIIKSIAKSNPELLAELGQHLDISEKVKYRRQILSRYEEFEDPLYSILIYELPEETLLKLININLLDTPDYNEIDLTKAFYMAFINKKFNFAHKIFDYVIDQKNKQPPNNPKHYQFLLISLVNSLVSNTVFRKDGYYQTKPVEFLQFQEEIIAKSQKVFVSNIDKELSEQQTNNQLFNQLQQNKIINKENTQILFDLVDGLINSPVYFNLYDGILINNFINAVENHQQEYVNLFYKKYKNLIDRAINKKIIYKEKPHHLNDKNINNAIFSSGNFDTYLLLKEQIKPSVNDLHLLYKHLIDNLFTSNTPNRFRNSQNQQKYENKLKEEYLKIKNFFNLFNDQSFDQKIIDDYSEIAFDFVKNNHKQENSDKVLSEVESLIINKKIKNKDNLNLDEIKENMLLLLSKSPPPINQKLLAYLNNNNLNNVDFNNIKKANPKENQSILDKAEIDFSTRKKNLKNKLPKI